LDGREQYLLHQLDLLLLYLPIHTAPNKHRKGIASPWNKEQLSGSTTRRVSASSAARMAKTFSFTSRRSNRMASVAFKKVKPYSSTSLRDRRAGKQKTSPFCNAKFRKVRGKGGASRPFRLLHPHSPTVTFSRSHLRIRHPERGAEIQDLGPFATATVSVPACIDRCDASLAFSSAPYASSFSAT